MCRLFRLTRLCTLLSFLLSAAPGQVSADSNICGTVLSSSELLRASDVYACLTSTPFKADVAVELLDYWKTTLTFQSTLTYLQDPPRAYQQPAIDLLRGLDLIRAQIDAGVFENQYAFEAAVQTLLQATHDGNVYLAGSVLGVFVFGLPYNLVSVSSDGVSVPSVFIADDLVGNPNSSPITKINDDLAEDFLAVFASENSIGFIEPHGDWNGLMFSWAGANLGYLGSVTETVLYPGDNFTLQFANGTRTEPMPWAAYNIQGANIPLLETGDDFYNYFVLGQLPQTPSPTTTQSSLSGTDAATATDDSATAIITDDPTATAVAEQTVQGWGGAYPAVADVVQDNLGTGGFLTGYFLNDTKTGVISIPSFQLTFEAEDTFSSTIGQFLQRSKQAGMETVVIDLQQNYGGELLLAVDTFAQFFPNINPFSGMRSRSFDLADQLGNTFTNLLLNNRTSLNATSLSDITDSIWAVTEGELNVNTNANFTSWAEYYGPNPDHGDYFSTVFTYNLTNLIYTDTAGDLILYPASQRPATPPYDPQDIVILTDGACSSECDVFIELMHYEAGVRTVVVGGLPQYGPMQARGGTRGAEVYTSDCLDDDIMNAGAWNATLRPLLPNRTSDVVDQSRLTFNFADQIRRSQSVPLQFVYEAADCRIFWKLDTFNNFTALWEHASEATFRNGTLCVPRSAEHNNTMQTDVWGPSSEQKEAWAATNPAWVSKQNHSLAADPGLAQFSYDPDLHQENKRTYDPKVIDAECHNDADCGGNANGVRCVPTAIRCGLRYVTQSLCKVACLNGGNCGKQHPNTYKPACSKLRSLTPACQPICFCSTANSYYESNICKSQTGPATVESAHDGEPTEVVVKRVV